MRMWKLFVIVGMTALAANAAAQESPTLRKIKETGVITLGFRDKSIPFSYLDQQQRPIGYSMDLCYRVVESLKTRLKLPGLEVMLRPVTAANRVSFVVNDIIDMECGSTSNTINRQKEVAFSVTTYVAASSLVSKKANNIQSLQDLKGRTAVSTAGTTTMKALAEVNRTKELGMRLLAGKDHPDAFLLVETDRAVAFVMDDVLLHGLAASSSNPANYVIVNADLRVEPYGIILRKNDPEFKKIVDEAIVEVFKSGEIQQIYRKWFQAPIAPNKISLQLPMSNALKNAIANPTDSGNPAAYR